MVRENRRPLRLAYTCSANSRPTNIETALPLTLGQAGAGHNSSTAWDYFHINSIAKGDDGHYLLSSRHASTIFKINGTDGSIIWRLGGEFSDFELGPEVQFGFQHHARYLTRNDTVVVTSLFDNSVYGSESAGGGDKEVRLYPFSRGKYIVLDHVDKTAKLLQAFHPPNNDILTKSQGSLQTLPNGNVLINWGSEGQITEYTPDAKAIFHAYLDSGFLGEKVQNYRAFRYNWTGYSPETPAVFAELESEGTTVTAYVSWNGDTRTAFWRFIWVESDEVGEQTTSERTVRKSGFETKLVVSVAALRPAARVRISAEALDATGRVLSRSAFVAAQSSIGADGGEDIWDMSRSSTAEEGEVVLDELR